MVFITPLADLQWDIEIECRMTCESDNNVYLRYCTGWLDKIIWTKWCAQNGMDGMVYGQNACGQNGMDKKATIFGRF